MAQPNIDLVTENLKDLPHAAERLVHDAADFAQLQGEAVRSGINDARRAVWRAYEAAENTIRQNPFVAVLGAAAIGLVVGTLLRGSSSPSRSLEG